MSGARKFDDLPERLARAVAGSPDAGEVAAELRRLSAEIGALSSEDPFPSGVAAALRMTDGSGSFAASLGELAADILHDHAGEAGWSREDLRLFLNGLGHGRAEFLATLADAIETPPA